MSLNLVYVAGPPAAGKSALMAALTFRCAKSPRHDPFAHRMLVHPGSGRPLGIELGADRPGFPGTDTLSLSVAPVAKRWIAAAPAPLVLGEGDRLAFPGFLEAALTAGYTVTLVSLTCDQRMLDVRCAERGSDQHASWRGGRATKAVNLATWAGAHGCQVIDASSTTAPATALAAAIRDAVPVVGALP